MSELLKIFAENSSVVLLINAETGSIADANRSAVEFYGYSYEELLQANIADLDVLNKTDLTEQLQLINPQKIEQATFTHRLKNGSLRNISAFVSACNIEGRKLILAIIYEITDPKITEEANIKSALLFNTMPGISKDGIHIVNDQLELVEANSAFCDLLGYSMEEAKQLRIPDWDMQWTEEEMHAKFNDLVLNPGLFETRHRHKDGRILDMEISAVVVEQDGQKYLYASSRDITERKKNERILNYTESKLRAVLDHSFDAIGVHINGIWEMCNPAAIKLFGYSTAKELIGTPLINVIAPSEHDRIKVFVKNRTEGRVAPLAYITLGIKKDGTVFDMEVSLSDFMHDNTLHVMVVLRDITERKGLEALLKQSEIKLQRGEIIGKFGYLRTDLNTGTVELSIGTGAIYGFDTATASLEDIKSLRLPEYAALMDQALKELVEENKPYDIYYKCRRKNDGAIIDIHTIATYNSKHNVVFGTVQDITKLRKQEAEIAKFKTITDNAIHYIGIASLDGKVLYFNNAIRKALAVPDNADLQGYDVFDFYSPAGKATIADALIEIEKNGYWSGENEIQSLDGKIYQVLQSIVLIKDTNGNPAFIATTIVDITSSKILEAERQALQERLQKITARVPGILYQFKLSPDGNMSFPYISDAVNTLYGIPMGEIIHDASIVFAKVHPQDYDRTQWSIQQSAAELSTWNHEFRVKLDDGTIHYLLGNSAPQKEPDGSIIWDGILTDITQQKNAEEEILRLNKELHELAKHLQYTREYEINKLAVEVHDKLGQNLVAIKYEIEWLKHHLNNDKKAVEQKVNALSVTITEMITEFQNIYNKVNPTLIESLDLFDSVEWLVNSCSKKNITTTFSSNIEKLKFSNEIKLALYKTVEESLANTIAYSKASRVSVSLKKQLTRLSLVIKDNGCGFDISKVNTQKQHGILEMRERVNGISGEFNIYSILGQGTLTEVTVKIK